MQNEEMPTFSILLQTYSSYSKCLKKDKNYINNAKNNRRATWYILNSKTNYINYEIKIEI